MKTLAAGCRNWALLYLTIAAAIAALVYQRFPDLRAAAIGGLAAGFFIWCSIGYIVGIFNRRKEVAKIQRAMYGDRPADGEKIAVAGTIGSSMEMLESPITKKPCLAYEYKLLAPGNQQFGVVEGFALAPLTINGPRGSIRLMAAPELDFRDQPLGSREHQQNFNEYMERTTFNVRAALDIKRALTEMRAVMADDDGRIRYDIRHENPYPASDLTLLEKTLAPGDQVVAVGRYSAGSNALVPDPTVIGYPVKITKGTPEDALKKLRGKTPLELVMSCGCLLPVIAAAIIGASVIPLSAIEQMFPKKDPSWTEVRLEKKLREELKHRGWFQSDGVASILLEPGQARGKVSIGGKTTPLTHASAKKIDDGGADVTLSGDGIEVQVRIRNDRLESVRAGDVSFPADQIDTEPLTVYGAYTEGRLSYAAEGEGPKLRVMFKANFDEPAP